MKTIIIPEINIEVEISPSKPILQKEIEIPEGWRILSECRENDNVNECILIINSKYQSQLKLFNDWEWIEQPFQANKLRFPFCLRRVYRTRGLSLFAYLDNLPGSIVAGRVRFCRDLVNRKNLAKKNLLGRA